MFNLTEAITQFNRIHQKRIQLNKTWGLIYLQPKPLAFLNQCDHLIQESVYYASPFLTNRRALRAAFAKTNDQSFSEALPTLHTIVQQLKRDESIQQRLEWEELQQTLFDEETFWQQGVDTLKNNSRAKQQLRQIYQDWKQHQRFQYHSSRGLLFLIDTVVEYQYHFTRAHEELERKQRAWLPSQRLPYPIAATYRWFLETQLINLEAVKNQVLEALLLRLKNAAQQNQVTNDDLSYTLVEQSQQLGLSLPITLPKYQRVLDATTFNRIQRAIEKYGNIHHKQQLYRLAWYHSAKFNVNKAMTLVTISGHRLIVPTTLLPLVPKKVRKPAWLFRNNQARLAFLEKQQALLAQLILPLDFTPLSPNSLSTLHLTLKPFIIRYQLLQESLQLLEQQPTVRWWQWRQKRWKKAWQKWLTQYFRKNQENLREVLNHFSNHLQTHKEWLSQATYRQPIHDNLMHIQHLIDKRPREDCCPRLTLLIKRLLAQLQAKAEEIAREKRRATSLTENFKQDLSTILEAYINYYHEEGRVIPKARMADIDYLRQLLNTTHDFLPLREGVRQRYQRMQRSQLAKLMTSLDGSILRHGLRSILENPNYRVTQFKRVVTTLSSSSQEVLYQENNLPNFSLKDKESTVDTQAITSIAPDVNNNEVLAMKQQLTQMQAQIQQLINNTEYADPLLKSSDIVSNHFCFFNAPQGIIKPIH